jgi:hypothetical protein
MIITLKFAVDLKLWRITRITEMSEIDYGKEKVATA